MTLGLCGDIEVVDIRTVDGCHVAVAFHDHTQIAVVDQTVVGCGTRHTIEIAQENHLLGLVCFSEK